MNNFALFFDWYSRRLPQRIYQVWLNFIWFVNNYFSLVGLVRTFFYPWKGYSYPYKGGGFDPARWLGNFIFNMFSRIIGMILRFFLIIIGVSAEIFVVILGILFFFTWLIFPILLILCFLKGFRIL